MRGTFLQLSWFSVENLFPCTFHLNTSSSPVPNACSTPMTALTRCRPKLRHYLAVALFCLASAALSAAQSSGPMCQVTVLPASGTAPLQVQAIGGCLDGSSAIV